MAEYDDVGQLVHIEDHEQTRDYVYDEQGQLLSETWDLSTIDEAVQTYECQTSTLPLS